MSDAKAAEHGAPADAGAGAHRERRRSRPLSAPRARDSHHEGGSALDRLCNRLGGVWEGMSVSRGSESTKWQNTLLKFSVERDGDAASRDGGGGGGGDDADGKSGASDATARVRVVGAGVSLWKGRAIEFTLAGSLNTATRTARLVKQHHGAFTNRITYDVKLLGADEPGGCPELDGRYSNGTINLGRVEDQLSGVWRGESVSEKGEVTMWASTYMAFRFDQAAMRGKVIGRGVSTWRDLDIEFDLTGTFDWGSKEMRLVKQHRGRFTNRIRYDALLFPDTRSISGQYKNGVIELTRQGALPARELQRLRAAKSAADGAASSAGADGGGGGGGGKAADSSDGGDVGDGDAAEGADDGDDDGGAGYGAGAGSGAGDMAGPDETRGPASGSADSLSPSGSSSSRQRSSNLSFSHLEFEERTPGQVRALLPAARALADAVSGVWEGTSSDPRGHPTRWKNTKVILAVDPATGHSVVRGRGVSLWKGASIPFELSGEFDARTMCALVIKQHAGRFTNKVPTRLKLAGLASIGDRLASDAPPTPADVIAACGIETSENGGLRLEGVSQRDNAVVLKRVGALGAAAEAEAREARAGAARAAVAQPALSLGGDSAVLQQFKAFLMGLLVHGSLGPRQHAALQEWKRQAGVGDAMAAAALAERGLTDSDLQVDESLAGPDASGAGGMDDDDDMCRICFAEKINVVLLPCGHVVLCKSCAPKLRDRLCPICRRRIEQANEIFRA